MRIYLSLAHTLIVGLPGLALLLIGSILRRAGYRLMRRTMPLDADELLRADA